MDRHLHSSLFYLEQVACLIRHRCKQELEQAQIKVKVHEQFVCGGDGSILYIDVITVALVLP